MGKEKIMAHLSLELPSMYGDHHVLEVRRILLGFNGVKEVYASSAFQVVEVDYDGRKTTKKTLIAALEDAGYTSDFNIPEEQSIPAHEGKETAYFRHTEASENTGNTVSFEQAVRVQRSPLWPCPGMGPIKTNILEVDEETEDG
jgi:copper chaperone CopZ